MFTTSGTYPWSFVTQIFHNGQPSHGGNHEIFKVMTSTLPKGTLGSVASLLAATGISYHLRDISGLTKPGEVGDFFALVSMKSPIFCQKAKF